MGFGQHCFGRVRCRETLCMDKEICGCIQRTSYGLPWAWEIATKILEDKPILLNEINHHWHRLRMGEESNDHGFSVDEEWNGIQERLKKSLTKWSLKSKRFCGSWHFLKPSWCLHHHEKYQPRKPRKNWILRGLKEKLHRLVESLLRGRLLIPKIWIVNRQHHQQLHHLKEKEVLVLVKHHFPHFYHLLGIQSLRLFRLWGLLIICHASCFHLLKKWWML